MNTFAIVLMFVLIFLGFPIVLSLGLGAVLVLLPGGIPLSILGNFFYENIYSFSRLAVPMFIFAGALILATGMGGHLAGLFRAWIGHLPGGLAIAMVLAATFFGAMSGSTLACMAAIGDVMVPPMLEAGYKRGFATGLLAVCGALGNLIPPSVSLITLGIVFQISTASLFAAELIPGLILSALLVIASVVVCSRQGFRGVKAESWKVRGNSTIKAIPGLIMIFVILGGIYGGVFTPTEAAAVSCAVAIGFGFTIYRKGMTWAALWKALTGASRTGATLFFLMGAGMITGHAFTIAGLPQAIFKGAVALNLTGTTFLWVTGALMLVLGTAFDAALSVYVTGTILFPAAVALGIHPLHFSIFFLEAGLVAAIMPPVAINVFFVADKYKTPFMEVTKGSMPFLFVMIVGWALVIQFPALTTWLPHVLGMS